MKTNVHPNSIHTYHNLNSKNNQHLLIADFMVEETKHGRAHSARTVADYFNMRGNREMGITGTISGRFDEIKANGVIYNGFKYVLKSVGTKINDKTKRQNEYFFMVIEKPKEAVQTTMF